MLYIIESAAFTIILVQCTLKIMSFKIIKIIINNN